MPTFNNTISLMKSLKVPAILYAAMSFVLFFAVFYSGFDNHFPVQHLDAIKGNSNFPESYVISISPALAFEYTWSVGRVLGIIIWLALGVFMAYVALDRTIKSKSAIVNKIEDEVTSKPVIVSFALMVISVFLIFHSSSKLVAGNFTRVVSPQKFEQIKDSKDSLEALFPKSRVF